MATDPYLTIVRRQALREATLENSARHAAVFAHVDTQGWGEYDIKDEITFDLTFVQEPNVAHGYACIADDQPEGDIINTRYPRAYGFVTEWSVTPKGFYTGAFVSIVVDTLGLQLGSLVNEPNYTIRHSMTFTGVALKEIGSSDADNETFR